MASKSTFEKMAHIQRLITKHAAKRAELRKKANDPEDPDQALAQATLQKLPRNSSRVRLRRICKLSGRSRAYYRKFGLSRIKLRELALQGLIPGMKKASW